MEQTKIWLSSPHMGGTELEYIKEAFDSNWIAPLGPNVTNFEIALERFQGNNSFVACLSSGTAALHLSLVLSDVGPGDEVLCQSFTFSASANPIRYQQAVPIFIDSEEDTWNMCPDALESAIIDRLERTGQKPKAIIVVHLYGMPAKMDRIAEIASRYEITLIEDAAEALGSTYKGQKCGTFGKFGVLSFNGNKIITTSGGGALVCTDKASKEKAIFLATQARDDAPHYQHSHVGYNYRMSNITAGVGRGQMEVLESRIQGRRSMNLFYKELFANNDGIKVFSEPDSDFYSNHWLTCVVINPELAGFDREALRLALSMENIESRPLWKPMHLQPIFQSFPFYGTHVAEKLFDCGLCLPSGTNLSSEERSRLHRVISDFVA